MAATYKFLAMGTLAYWYGAPAVAGVLWLVAIAVAVVAVTNELERDDA